MRHQDVSSLLYHAVKSDDIEQVRQLVYDGADPNMPYSGGKILLHYAAEYSSLTMCELLIDYGATKYYSDRWLCKPYHYAVNRDPAIFDLLFIGADFPRGEPKMFGYW
eukprot:Colp12_sorted_trinity150504_noHs@3520